ncbi:hypothetical protein CH063_12105 [Colletotrichum higginsianum]|nr:hypothetical protein CH063_12105 [Colletotrichum higginsianum]
MQASSRPALCNVCMIFTVSKSASVKWWRSSAGIFYTRRRDAAAKVAFSRPATSYRRMFHQQHQPPGTFVHQSYCLSISSSFTSAFSGLQLAVFV